MSSKENNFDEGRDARMLIVMIQSLRPKCEVFAERERCGDPLRLENRHAGGEGTENMATM